MMRDVVIVGVGGQGRVIREYIEDVNEAARRWHFRGFVDDSLEGDDQAKITRLGPVDWLWGRDCDVLIGIGAPAARRTVVSGLRGYGDGLRFPALVHPRAYTPRLLPIGVGCVVHPGACIDPHAKLEDFVVINSNATVGHDTVLSSYVTVAPGACIGGNVMVGEGADIGIGASCKQGLTLGAHCRVGAGAAVVKDVPAGATVVGVPARPLRRRTED